MKDGMKYSKWTYIQHLFIKKCIFVVYKCYLFK